MVRRLRAYLGQRPRKIREELSKFLDAGTSYAVSIDAPTSVAFVVDGYRKVGSHEGWYFEGMPVQMQVSGEDAAAFSHWLVDGERRDDVRLVERIEHDTSIHAVMRDEAF